MLHSLGLALLLATVPLLQAANPAGTASLAPQLLKEVDARVQETLSGYDAMVIGLVRSGRIVLTRAYGKGRLDASYEYGSVSKPVTSAILLKLLQEGKIKSLDDNLWIYVPTFKGTMPAAFRDAPLTLRHLLTHQSGIPHNSEAPWIDGVLNVKFRPGTEHRYSTPGYGLLGLVIEEVTGLSYPEAVRKYVGQPLGATSMTAYETFIAPGAYVTSNIADLARFAIGMMSPAYIPAPLREEAWRPTLRSYGLGWTIQDVGSESMQVSHGGSNGAPRAYLLVQPRRGSAVVLMAQRNRMRETDIARLAGDLLLRVDGLREGEILP
jgi:CubicO group peptidase (beta-lactamase class C family)